MSGIFISYRRDDTAGYARRVYDAIAHRFGDDRVFMDIDSLKVGLDFSEARERRIAAHALPMDVFSPLISGIPCRGCGPGP